MECPNIGNIKFSATSIDAIEDIRRRTAAADKLVKFIGAAHILNIFFGNGMLEATYSLYSTDFELMAEGMKSVPAAVKGRIMIIADETFLRVSDAKEKQFWRAVSSGCSIH